MKRFALAFLLPLAFGCGGNDSNVSTSTAGDVSRIDSPSLNIAGEACLAGTWEMDVEASYNVRAMNDMMAESGGEMTMKYGGSSGSATMILSRDGSAEYRLNNLAVTIEANMPMGAMTVTNTMNGTSTGAYSVEGDAMRFSNGSGTLSTNTEVKMGDRQLSNSSSDLDSIFDTPETSRMTFECADDVLLFDVHHPEEGGEVVFSDMRFIRAGGV